MVLHFISDTNTTCVDTKNSNMEWRLPFDFSPQDAKSNGNDNSLRFRIGPPRNCFSNFTFISTALKHLNSSETP